MCMKEGMRLHTPVPFIQRVATKSLTIDGNTFPAGTPLSVNLYSLHHNPEVWDDHDVFKPERFTEENFSKMDSFAYCPFSAGPRYLVCQLFVNLSLYVITYWICWILSALPERLRDVKVCVFTTATSTDCQKFKQVPRWTNGQKIGSVEPRNYENISITLRER